MIISQSFLDEEREIIFVFDKKGQEEDKDEIPQEHSPENHIFFNTYHYKDDLNTITEMEVRNRVIEVIKNVRSFSSLLLSSLK